MIIKPIKNISTFTADTKTVNPNTGEYRDPLMRWPLRGAAFTNEIGEALRPIIGKYATLTWAPALLYIGADIYDKYKNDQTEYSPNSRRCLKQACFQGLASILLPIFAVKGGQGLFSLFGCYTKDKVTFRAQEQVIELAQQYVANGKIKASSKEYDCIKEFIEIVENNIDYKNQEKLINNPFKKIINNHKLNSKENIHKYAKATITNLIDIRNEILNPTNSIKKSLIFDNYQNAIKAGQSRSVAIRSVLNQHLTSKTMQGRFIKTIGGFLALGIAIKPIDSFVEQVLIGKVIGPSIDKNT